MLSLKLPFSYHSHDTGYCTRERSQLHAIVTVQPQLSGLAGHQ